MSRSRNPVAAAVPTHDSFAARAQRSVKSIELDLASDGRTLVLFAGGVSAELGALSNPFDPGWKRDCRSEWPKHRPRAPSVDELAVPRVTLSTAARRAQTVRLLKIKLESLTISTDGYEIDFDGGQGSLSFDVPDQPERSFHNFGLPVIYRAP